MRIVGWNIRAGGGRRAEALSAQIRRWAPDVVSLSEFRGTPPGAEIARALAAQGLVHQESTADPERPGANCLLVASRWPLRRLEMPRAPREPGRWLLAAVAGPQPFALGAMHVPNRVTGRKWVYLDAVLRIARRWPGGPAVLVGDTNSGRRDIDEQVPAFNAREHGWMDGLEAAGWRDAFRHLQGAQRVYTWYSPNGGNGFRIDQAFVNDRLLSALTRARYAWARPRPGGGAGQLSDHAAIVLDFTM